MSRRDVLALSDCQLHAIELAAASLPPTARSDFLVHVAAQLSGKPSDDAVQIAINLMLDRAAAVRLGE